MNKNVLLLEERLSELRELLNEHYKTVALLKKDKHVPSPGLLKSIKILEMKQATCMESLEIWKGFLKVYPNYDR